MPVPCWLRRANRSSSSRECHDRSRFSGAQLRTLYAVDSRAIVSFWPGVFPGGSLGRQNLKHIIRGVTHNDFNDIVEAPNAMYLDEGHIALGQGRNATGGLVPFITVKPSLDAVNGFIDVRGGIFDPTGSRGSFRGEAALNVPLNDEVPVRVAGMSRKVGPYIRNIYRVAATGGSHWPGAGSKSGAEDTLGGRFSPLLDPGDGARLIVPGNAVRSIRSPPLYQEKSPAKFEPSRVC